MTIKLGQKARDVITGFEGIVLCITQHLTGCNQVCLLPQTLDKDGKRRDGEWFDDSRIQILDKTPLQLQRTAAEVKANPGADEPLPTIR
jgi:hypothetical protein